MCARPLKDISELSPERLRKLSAYEIAERQQEEEQREVKKKQAIKVKKRITKSLKAYFKNIELFENGEVELKTLEILEPLVSELIFTEKLLENIKSKLIEDGLFINGGLETSPAMKEYKDLTKIKINLVDKINNHLSKLEIKGNSSEEDNFDINNIDMTSLMIDIKGEI